MSTDFPTSIDAMANPATTDYLDDPSHADQHANANDAIEALEAKLGIGASTATANKVLRGTGAGATAFGQIVTADITDANVTAGKLATDAVETAKIKALNVTTAKIAANAIISSKLSTIIQQGWLDFGVTATYGSATTITVPSGAAAKYAVGDKIKLTQTTVKYFYVTAVADTVLTVTGGTDYTVANAAITSPYYSKAASPVGFPNHTATMLGYAERETDEIFDAEEDISGLAVTVTTPVLLDKRIKISFGINFQNNDSATSNALVKIKEGSTTLRATKTPIVKTGTAYSFDASVLITPTAGSHTYKISCARNGGANTLYIRANSEQPAHILVELV